MPVRESRSVTPGVNDLSWFFREIHGLTGTEGLSDIQKNIYEFIRARGKATRVELSKEFNLKPFELENEFAILRHCRILKAKRENDNVYLVLW